MTSEQRRVVVTEIMRVAALSERKACRYSGILRSLCRYVSTRPGDTELRTEIVTVAASHPRWGVPRIVWRLKRNGWTDNHKRIERIYREEGLAVRRRSRVRKIAYERVPKPPALAINDRWSMDFVRDTLSSGRVFRAFTLVDDCTRECPVIEVDTSLTGERVVRILDRLRVLRGIPGTIVCDNGPEFVSKALSIWAEEKGVKLHFIEPGKPVQNCYIESFNGKLRDECLNQHWFMSLNDAKRKIESWRVSYNTDRPHSGINGSTPQEFAKRIEKQLNSKTKLSA